jgi:hypothetical protein
MSTIISRPPVFRAILVHVENGLFRPMSNEQPCAARLAKEAANEMLAVEPDLEDAAIVDRLDAISRLMERKDSFAAKLG